MTAALAGSVQACLIVAVLLFAFTTVVSLLERAWTTALVAAGLAFFAASFLVT